MGNLISELEILKENEETCDVVHVSETTHSGSGRKLYIESYGCQMNFSDSEIVASILKKDGFDTTSDIHQADVIFLNTCSIR
jgi:tRNA-2-methylthio-N6-dimethylallyladenosine synthase